MAVKLCPESGARPWAPAFDVVPLLELDRHNFPLSGLLEQAGTKYLFTCILGEVNEVNVWAYAHVDETQVDRLMSLRGDELIDAIEAALVDKMLLVAAARDWKLVDWHMIDAGHEGPIGIVKRFIGRCRISLAQHGISPAELTRQAELVEA